ncbi:hypothetical protein J8L88_16895 [Aquimarina sp. MMG015]|uniref:hypothetical protein n=1 Tax=Aquimarina sp. MMG015 TaxID=2822689 RepID=UPI001B39EFCE|nr:hypothetical protein [Aquimarina sp. MMG015]MBQ4804541.1 hypothetical protein [Aquimarina sp. MMG015]
MTENLKIGNIVEYDNEYGVVIEIPITDDNGKYVSGDLLVRWDTDNENDIESCLGNLEGLIKKVEYFELNFIDENGNTKEN